MSPTFVAPAEAGFHVPRAKIVPSTPPCLQKPTNEVPKVASTVSRDARRGPEAKEEAGAGPANKAHVADAVAQEEVRKEIREEVAKDVKAAMEVNKHRERAGPAPGPAAAAAPAAANKCVDCAGMEGFGEEAGCGPLCKLEHLVGDLKDAVNTE